MVPDSNPLSTTEKKAKDVPLVKLEETSNWLGIVPESWFPWSQHKYSVDIVPNSEGILLVSAFSPRNSHPKLVRAPSSEGMGPTN